MHFLFPMIGDHMVLQRDQSNVIWGWDEPGTRIDVCFGSQRHRAATQADGRWQVTLWPLPAGGPYELTVSGSQTARLTDIWMGDVYLLGGQSNMELPIRRVMERFRQEINDDDYPMIRQFNVPQVFSFHGPQSDIQGGAWRLASGAALQEFSALGYFFAKEVYARHRVPIGLIHTPWGGTQVEDWMSREALLACSDGTDYLPELTRLKDASLLARLIDGKDAYYQQWHADLRAAETLGGEEGVVEAPASFAGTALADFCGCVYLTRSFSLTPAQAEKDAVLYLGTLVDSDDVWVNGQPVGQTGYRYPPRIYPVPAACLRTGKNEAVIRLVVNQGAGGFTPGKQIALKWPDDRLDLSGEWRYRIAARCAPMDTSPYDFQKTTGLYNSMIAPIAPVALTSVLWYQGESNTERPTGYQEHFEALIACWRRAFDRPELPFMFVQLANFDDPVMPKDAPNWAQVRQAQQNALRVPNTAMAVAIDIGEYNDLHPLNKKELARRLALCAQGLIYHDSSAAQSPVALGWRVTKDGIVIDFSGSALVQRQPLEPALALLDAAGRAIPYTAELSAHALTLRLSAPARVREARYLCANSPAAASLYDEENSLPAAPFWLVRGE